MNFLGIIPARYSSTRFPGKPLAMIGNRSMIEWVYSRSIDSLDELYVATDDNRIFEHVRGFGGNVIMTSEKHRSGTDRSREAMESIIAGTGFDPDVVINIQGDEPFIKNEQIEILKKSFEDRETEISTLAKVIDKPDDIFNENMPKVVFDQNYFALYFSRSPIPFIRGKNQDEWHLMHNFFRHLGIYAYRKTVLRKITDLEPGGLEIAESLEQLRWLQNGFRIKISETDYESIGVDTPDDLKRAITYLERSIDQK